MGFLDFITEEEDRERTKQEFLRKLDAARSIQMPSLGQVGGALADASRFYTRNVSDPFAEVATQGFQTMQGNPQGILSTGRTMESIRGGTDPLEALRQERAQRNDVERFATGMIFDPINLAGVGLVSKGLRGAAIGINAVQGMAGGAETGQAFGGETGSVVGAVLGGGLGGGLAGKVNRALGVGGADDASGLAMGAVAKGKKAAASSAPSVGDEAAATVVRNYDLRDQVLQAANAATKDGAARNFPTPIRKVMGLVNPSLDLDRRVVVANRAGPIAQASFMQNIATSEREMLARVKEAFPTKVMPWIDPEEKAAFIKLGPRYAAIVEEPALAGLHPEWFALNDAQKAAVQMMQVHGDRTVDFLQRHGSDVEKFVPKRPGAIYIPTAAKADDALAERTIMSGLKRLTKVGEVKERYYQDFLERMAHDKNFIPETDLDKIWVNHDKAFSKEAAREVQLAALGGKTRTEVLAETNPELLKRRDILSSAVSSLQESINRRLHNIGLTQAQRDMLNEIYESTETRVANQLNAQMRMVDDDVVNRSLGRVEALRKQLSVLLQMEQPRAGTVGTLTKDISYLQGELARRKAELLSVRKAYSGLQPEGYSFDASTSRWFPTDVKLDIQKVMQRVGTHDMNGFFEMMDHSRNLRFGLDGGLLFIQGLNSMAFDPRRWRYLGQALRSMGDASFIDEVAKAEHDDVVKYAMYTGRTLGTLTEEMNPGLLDTLPVYGRFAKAQERTLDLLNYRGVKNDAYLLMKHGVSEYEAWAEAANANSKMSLRLNPADRGLSQTRSRGERMLLTSVSFTTAPPIFMKDATMGWARYLKNFATRQGVLGSWDAMPGRERLAAQRLVLFFGTMEAVSLASAAAFDPEHAEDAVNPNSPRFMSLFLPGGGSIALGGPFRSAFRAMVPTVDPKTRTVDFTRLGGWMRGKLHPVPSAFLDVIENEDYRGQKIATKEGMMGFLQSAGHILENTLMPSALQAGVKANRMGQSLGEGAVEVATSLSGTTFREQTPNEALNRLAESEFQKARFIDLTPTQKQQLRDTYPDIFEKRMRLASADIQEQEAVRTAYYQQQLASDERFKNGELTYAEWKNDYGDRRDKQRAALEPMMKKRRASEDPILSKYFATLNEHTGADGKVKWDEVDAFVAELPEEEQKYITNETSVGGTQMVRTFNAMKKQASPLLKEYKKLPSLLGATAEEGEAASQLREQARSLQAQTKGRMPLSVAIRRVASLQGADSRIVMLAITADRRRNPKKHQFWKANPILEQVYGSLAPEELRNS